MVTKLFSKAPKANIGHIQEFKGFNCRTLNVLFWREAFLEVPKMAAKFNELEGPSV